MERPEGPDGTEWQARYEAKDAVWVWYEGKVRWILSSP